MFEYKASLIERDAPYVGEGQTNSMGEGYRLCPHGGLKEIHVGPCIPP
jgi:hypothetical protein